MKIYALNYQSNHNITAKNPIIEEIYLSATQVWKQAHTICTLWQEIIQSHLGVCIVKPWHIISMNLIRCNALFFSPRFMCFNVYKAVSCITLFSASKMKAEIRVAYERKHAFSIKKKFACVVYKWNGVCISRTKFKAGFSIKYNIITSLDRFIKDFYQHINLNEIHI